MTTDTPPAAIPDAVTVGTLAVFGDQQTAALDRANADKRDIIAFDRRCRERDDALRASLKKRRIF